MNELTIFKNENFGEIRTLVKDSEPWFVLADVCKALELEQVSRVAVRLNPDGVTKIKGIENSGFGERKIELNIINEMNLYKCILRSNKPEAEKFQDWVCGEILPAIRKHGMYATDELLNNPDLFIKVLTDLKKERELKEIEQKQKRKAWSGKGGLTKNRNFYKDKTNVLTCENDKLKEEIGLSKDFATVKRIEIITNKKFPWSPLRKYSRQNNLEIKEVPDPNFQSVKAYHKFAWLAVYNINLEKLA